MGMFCESLARFKDIKDEDEGVDGMDVGVAGVGGGGPVGSGIDLASEWG